MQFFILVSMSSDVSHPNKKPYTFFRGAICTAPGFSLASPKGGEGRGKEVPIFPDQIPSPQPSPRLGGEKEPGGSVKLHPLFPSIRLGFVQMFAGRQVGELFKMLGAHRLGYGVLGVEPFAEVHQLATLRTKRPKPAGRPVAGFFARRALRRSPGFIWFRLQSS